MENRLFLLEEPEQNFDELKDFILAGKDVTPETEYSGKITLTQLNAYSGELKAEALTNFKTIKIEKDGSTYETNVAKLLLELQQGGGADDAREEADIAIASVEGDEDLKIQITELSRVVESRHNKYKDVALAGYKLAVASPHSYVRWAESQAADGVRTRFAAEDGMTFGEGIITILNGVVVTPEDGEIIISEFGPYAIGFEFNVAPTVGDIVEFYVGMVIGKSSRPYEDVNKENEKAENAAITEFEKWDLERMTEIGEFNSQIVELESDKEKLQEELDAAFESLDAMKEEYSDAESVDLINKFAKGIKDLTKEVGDLQRDMISIESSIKVLSNKKVAADKSLDAGRVERLKAADDFAKSKEENDLTIEMFNSIKNESDNIGSEE